MHLRINIEKFEACGGVIPFAGALLFHKAHVLFLNKRPGSRNGAGPFCFLSTFNLKEKSLRAYPRLLNESSGNHSETLTKSDTGNGHLRAQYLGRGDFQIRGLTLFRRVSFDGNAVPSLN